MRNKLLNITLIVGLIIGLYLHDEIITTIALLSGFVNVFFTTRKSKYFIIPDLIWIVTTVYSLMATQNYSDIPLYAYYLLIAFIQFKQWSTHESTEDGETIMKKADKRSYIALLCAFVLSVTIYLLTPSGANMALLGAFISGIGIVASTLLAYRYYMAELMFVFVNIAQVYVYVSSGLTQLSLIPMVFLINGLIFIIFNRVEEE